MAGRAHTRRNTQQPAVEGRSALEQQQDTMQRDGTDADSNMEEAQQRISSHMAAAPGPSSIGKAKQSRKRTGQGALQNAIALLPANLDEEMLCRTWQRLHPRHKMQKHSLQQCHKQQFPNWRFLLRQRFSLLFYGFGSKRSLIEQFASESLTDGGVLACYGNQPGVTAKQLLAAVAGALTHRNCKSYSHGELLGMINNEHPGRQLYVVVHNIDGPGLRSRGDQLWLSRLAQAPAVRLMASVDHVNATLLWDNRTAAAFNWIWQDVTNYAGYEAETSGILPILTSCKQSAAKRGAATVLSSLVSSAKEVFNLLASVQLEEPSAPGVGFPLLLRMVRERFIMNTEHALKSVLTEFRDHELIKLRVGPDGGEVMYIPMDPDVLQMAMQEMNDTASA